MKGSLTMSGACWNGRVLYSLLYLFEQERRGSKCEGPSIAILEILLRTTGAVHHFVIDAGDVEDQAHH